MRYLLDAAGSVEPAPMRAGRRSGRAVLLAATALGISLAAVAAKADDFAPVTPDGLSPGDHYRLAFQTTDTIDASSADIGVYNALVNADAGLNSLLPSTTWAAIGSTSTVNAVDNINCVGCNSDPIFLVTGTEVGASSAALFDGGGYANPAQGSQLAPIDVTESGVTSSGYVWTGSNTDGTAYDTNGVGPLGSTTGESMLGISDYAEYGDGLTFLAMNVSNAFPLYAISGDLTVPGVQPVPEPMSASLLLVGGLGTALLRRLRRRAPLG